MTAASADHALALQIFSTAPTTDAATFDVRLRFPLLRPAATRDHYDLHRAALEWSLAEPIIIQSAEDVKSRADWKGRIEPYEHQVKNLFTFCRRLPVTLIADDVGLGKTISAGLIIAELLARRRVRRVLVLAPSILLPQWREEMESKFGIRAREVKGNELDTEISRPSEANIIITTYETARARLDRLRPDAFEMLVLDEAHRLRNLYGTNAGPPVFAQAVRRALEERQFRYVLMLTATPIQNRLWDMYSLIDCLAVARGHPNPLGDPKNFKARYIAPDRNNQARKLQPKYAEEFRGILRQYVVRTRRGDARLVFPERKVATDAVRPREKDEATLQLVQRVVQDLNALAQTSVLQAAVSSPEALAAQLENMGKNRTVRMDAVLEARRIADAPGLTAKLERVARFVSQLRGERPDDWRLVVFTTRKETQRAIVQHLRGTGVSVGTIDGENPRGRQDAIEGFRADPPRYHVIVSTDAGAEGVNLQAGNIVVNYDLPWNPMKVEQRIGRVQRLGSKHAHVIVQNFVLAGSYEHHIVATLLEKLQVIAQTVGDIEALLEAVDMDEEDGDKSLEARIRELVLLALRGQDVSVATQRAVESIKEAKRLHESQSQELDATLGRCDELHEIGPRMPKIERVKPSMPVRDFVLATLRAMGGIVGETKPDLFLMNRAEDPSTVFTFSEDVHRRETQDGYFSGRSPLLYVPGHRDFERHTQHWVENHALFTETDQAPDPEVIEGVVRDWCARFPGVELEKSSVGVGWAGFEGTALCRAKVVNAVDSYECLFDVRIEDSCEHAAKLQSKPDSPETRPPDSSRSISALDAVERGRRIQELSKLLRPAAMQEAPGRPTASTRVAPMAPDERDIGTLAPTVRGLVEAAVRVRDDIKEFRRFYGLRLMEELQQAGNDPRRVKKVRDDFDPICYAEVVGASGKMRKRWVAGVQIRVDGAAAYTTDIPIAPDGCSMAHEPDTAECAITRRRIPAFALGTCSVSGGRGLRHMMTSSARSQRTMLPVHAKTCEETGSKFHPDEVAQCAVTGRTTDAALLVESAVSGKRALDRALVACEFSRLRALPNEVVTSEVSGKKLLEPNAARSAVSGVLGDRSEFVRCDVSQAWLLPRESGQSSVSGRVVRAELLRPSDKSPSRHGVDDEIVTCSATGKRLLIDEVVRSDQSRRQFDRDLAAKSEISGRVGAPDEFDVCTVSGKRCLDDELSTCGESGRRALRDHLVVSAVSRRLIHPDFVERSAKCSQPAGKSEIRHCDWTGTVLLPSELVQCKLTGLEFDADLVPGKTQALDALLRLLRRGDDEPVDSELAESVRRMHDPRLKNLRSIRSERSPSGKLIAACGTVLRFWPPGRDWLLFIVSGKSNDVLGSVARCRRTSTGALASFETAE
ncbi:MAG: DEAD/DEAH box helicase [Planctomycetota bacterium]